MFEIRQEYPIEYVEYILSTFLNAAGMTPEDFVHWNKGYKRLRRRGIDGVILELGLISCGFNLYKYHLKKIAMHKAA